MDYDKEEIEHYRTAMRAVANFLDSEAEGHKRRRDYFHERQIYSNAADEDRKYVETQGWAGFIRNRISETDIRVFDWVESFSEDED